MGSHRGSGSFEAVVPQETVHHSKKIWSDENGSFGWCNLGIQLLRSRIVKPTNITLLHPNSIVKLTDASRNKLLGTPGSCGLCRSHKTPDIRSLDGLIQPITGWSCGSHHFSANQGAGPDRAFTHDWVRCHSVLRKPASITFAGFSQGRRTGPNLGSRPKFYCPAWAATPAMSSPGLTMNASPRLKKSRISATNRSG